MKKILFISNGLASGGIERASSSLANYYSEQGYDVSIVALYKREHFYSIHPRVAFYEPSFERCKWPKYLYALKISVFLRKTIRRIDPDVILSFGEWFNSFVMLSTWTFHYPIYLSDRMSPTLNLGYLQESMRRFTYRRATGIISQTSFAAEVIGKKTGASNIAVIPNPVNIFKVPVAEKKKRIITIGRLSREKGHKYLVEAFALMKDKSWELSIVGDGPERPLLEKMAGEAGIADRVIFHGFRKDFSGLLAESEIFVLPSLSEGFPNALIEAMSVPLACISSDCVAGPRDIIDSGENGILVKPGDSEALKNELDKLAENARLRSALANAAYRVREDLKFSVIAERYLRFVSSGTHSRK